MMRIISERNLFIHQEMCACLIDWQKAFDDGNLTKLMQILKETGRDWRERGSISKCYMDQSVKVRLDQRETRSVKTEKRSYTRMLFVTNSVHLIQRVPCQRSP
jgi:hypothetical protein